MIYLAILAEKWSKEDILLTYLMVSLFIVYVIHSYLCLNGFTFFDYGI